jgi:hypothetical protein
MTDSSRNETPDPGDLAIERAATALERMAAALERMAAAIERAPAAPAPGPGPVIDERAGAVVAIRQAIQKGEWEDAGARLIAFGVAHPDDPDGGQLIAELAGAREAASRSLLARVDAARAANDPDRVLELRDALGLVLAGDPLAALDLDLARWFMVLIQKRLRGGQMRPEVAILAARVAERFDATPEGASLRAALPTLRRSAGLCARCGEPYTGIADACPKCLATPSFPALGTTPSGDSHNGHPVVGEPDPVEDEPDPLPDDLDSFHDDLDAP